MCSSTLLNVPLRDVHPQLDAVNAIAHSVAMPLQVVVFVKSVVDDAEGDVLLLILSVQHPFHRWSCLKTATISKTAWRS